MVNKAFKLWRRLKGVRVQTGQAQEIAGDVLLWVCGQEELLGVFLAATGAGPDALRAALQGSQPEPGLSAAALDFVMMRDDTVLQAAQALGLPADRLAMAQAVLAGAAGAHWT